MTNFHEELQTKAEAEALACIGCNECMLACPLPETSLVTIALLNDAVFASQPRRREVIEFSSSCTQCQQCVPVCPADLSRADMVLWNKIRVLDAEPDRELPLETPDGVQRALGWTLDRLGKDLARLPLFAGVPPEPLRRAALSSTLRRLHPGELLAAAGKWQEQLWLVLDGEVDHAERVEVPGGADRWQTLTTFGPGTFHGEQGVLGDRPEPFAIRASSAATVLLLPKHAVFRLEREAPAFGTRLREVFERRSTEHYLQSAPALEGLLPAERRRLAQAGTLRLLTAGHVLVEGNRSPESVFLVVSGFLRVSKSNSGGGRLGLQGAPDARVLVYLQEGDLFGVQAVLQKGQSLGRRVEAATRSQVLEIPGAALRSVLEEAVRQGRGQLGQSLRRRAVELELIDYQPRFDVAATESPVNAAASSRLGDLDLAMAGVLQGRELLVIDQRRCVDCDNCVDACGRRHRQSRLVRSGPVREGDLLFPSACRHCEDPVCLLCSVGGIVRLDDGQIQIVNDACIGCGACADRCPYDNIRMHPRMLEPRSRGGRSMAFDLWDYVRGVRPTDRRIDEVRGADAVAVKCDLCAGYEDYACVTACPTGAAFRIADAAELTARVRARDGEG